MLYHIVCPAKYRRNVFTTEVEETLKIVCQAIGDRYEIYFIEIGSDEDHVHFLVQSVPMMQPSNMVQIIKSITSRELFKTHQEIKKILWGGALWTTGYYINTVGQYGNEKIIKGYVRDQGKQYKQIYRGQLRMFE